LDLTRRWGMKSNAKYVVRLSAEERESLWALVNVGKVAAVKRRRSQILLKADAGPEGSGPTDREVAEALDVSIPTVHRVRQAFVEEGWEAAVKGRCQGRPRRPKLDGPQEARLIALACGPAPQGRGRWSLRLLARTLVELKIVDAIGKDAVRRTLKKTRSSPGSRNIGCCRSGATRNS
jgi:transposase